LTSLHSRLEGTLSQSSSFGLDVIQLGRQQLSWSANRRLPIGGTLDVEARDAFRNVAGIAGRGQPSERRLESAAFLLGDCALHLIQRRLEQRLS
jgi:hypothetical protein